MLAVLHHQSRGLEKPDLAAGPKQKKRWKISPHKLANSFLDGTLAVITQIFRAIN
jgi:hypothetical protein